MTTRREVLFGGAAMATTVVAGCATCGGGAFEMTTIAPHSMCGGAGLCVILRTPRGKTYLFDTANGDPHGRKTENNGREIIAPWLRAHGVSEIDGLIISHYHGDHFGGFLWLWDHFPIRRVYNNGFVPDTTGLSAYDLQEYRAARDVLDAWERAHPGCLVENLREGDDLGWDEPDVTFDVVWPPRDGYVAALEDRKGYSKRDNHFHHLLNANSNALQIRAFGKTFFIMGDIQADYIHAYMRAYLQKKGLWGCDCAVLPSHGTKPVETAAELAQMAPRPTTLIASLGDLRWMLDCGKEDLEVFGKAGYEIYVTNVHGDVTQEKRKE